MNPAYAIAELIWILSGRNDSAFPNYWNPALPKFAGTGDTYHGAYGYRLRKNLGIDQIERAYKALLNDPESRQVVLQIWDSRCDLPDEKGKPVAPDIPCNICSLPKVRNGKLEWLQIMRSNDVFLGTPNDLFWFMALQEIMAGWLGIEVGTYVHVSDSLHCYEHDLEAFYVSNKATIVTSTDDLAITKVESDRAVTLIENAMDRLRSPELTSSDYRDCIEETELPEGYQNMFLIVAADSARRRGWTEEVAHSVSKCTNPALSFAWAQWEQRKGKP
jgi:thymidylate synthase